MFRIAVLCFSDKHNNRQLQRTLVCDVGTDPDRHRDSEREEEKREIGKKEESERQRQIKTERNRRQKQINRDREETGHVARMVSSGRNVLRALRKW